MDGEGTPSGAHLNGPASGVPLTMSVAEYCDISGLTEYSVRAEIAADRIPHLRVGKRRLVRILRIPALAQLGVGS